jgi:hypothetical protein
MDCGACLGCGLGFNAPLQTNNDQPIAWQSGKPNPLPMFKNPYEFYTPLILPGPYLPVGLIAPYNVEDDLLYNPLSDVDLVDKLIAFVLHECIHETLLLGIIPTTLRLAAANFYTELAIALSRRFDSKLWDTLNHLNYAIAVIHNATAAMHEAAAIVENQITTPFNNPYIQALSAESYKNYAKEENYGSDFILYYQTFHSLITLLKEQFAPTSLQNNTIIALADYIISSAIDLQDLANDILKLPSPIADTSLRKYIGDMGIPYLQGGKLRTLKNCPTFQVGFGGFTVYGTGRRLERTMETILRAKFKRKRKMPEHSIDQLLYIAELVPELKLWLQSMDARHWLKRRILNAISDCQVYLEQYDVPLPLTEVWQSPLSAFISIKTGFDGKTLWTMSVGNQPEGFIARATKIPHEYWIAYCIQDDQPIGAMSSPLCRDGIPLWPTVDMIYLDAATELCRRLRTLIIFESLRMQLAAGCGIVCPWFEGIDSSCCGRAGTLWQVYRLGLEAAEKAGWQPKQWIAPECREPKTKRVPKVKSPVARTSRDSNILL